MCRRGGGSAGVGVDVCSGSQAGARVFLKSQGLAGMCMMIVATACPAVAGRGHEAASASCAVCSLSCAPLEARTRPVKAQGPGSNWHGTQHMALNKCKRGRAQGHEWCSIWSKWCSISAPPQSPTDPLRPPGTDRPTIYCARASCPQAFSLRPVNYAEDGHRLLEAIRSYNV